MMKKTKIHFLFLLLLVIGAALLLTGCCRHVPGDPATCDYPQVCTKCGKVLHKQLEHLPGPAATCSSPQICLECGKVLAEVPHTPGPEATCTTDQVCTVCGKVLHNRLWHDYSGAPATCTEPQICVRCGEELLPPSHTPSADTSCTTPVVCTVCGEELRPAMKHTPAEEVTCTEGSHCSRCGAEIPAHGHDFPDDVNEPSNWFVDIEPTDTTPGQMSMHCKKCGLVKESTIKILPPLRSVGLAYEVNPDGTSCTVTGVGTWTYNFLDIPEQIDGLTVIAIADGAFKDGGLFQRVILPDTITSIGAEAFAGCQAASEWKLSAALTSIGERAFAECLHMETLTLPAGITEIPANAFFSCGRLRTIILPSGLKKIGKSAFTSCAALSPVVVPEGVTEIGDQAFAVCVVMDEITLPASLTVLPPRIFVGTPVTRIHFGGNEAAWNALLSASRFVPESGLTVICSDKTLQY